MSWLKSRFPTETLVQHYRQHRVSRHLNAWYFWGAILLVVILLQVLSGFFLLMHYVPSALPNARGWSLAFASIFSLMHDVPWGWFIRYMHTTGASLLFVALYLHICRGLIYGSYHQGRELVWYFGCTLFLLFILEAFVGYLLPWGQMSYWSARVITHIISLIPYIGPPLFSWLFGETAVHEEIVHRFFAYHVWLIPVLCLVLIVMHILSLWHVGSSDPDGRPVHQQRTVPFHPYYTVKDICAVSAFLVLYFAIIFLKPTVWGFFIDPANALDAQPLVTPPDIHPVWYFMPFYSMLRAVTHYFLRLFTVLLFLVFVAYYRRLSWWGRMRMAMVCIVLAYVFHRTDTNLLGGLFLMLAPLMLYLLPSLDRSPVPTLRRRPWFHKVLYGLWIFCFVMLGILGFCDPLEWVTQLATLCTLFYFAFFLFMPIWSARGPFTTVKVPA